MRESEEQGAPVGGRFDLLLEQLGAEVVAESLGVDVGELARIQSGAVPLVGGIRARLDALALSMGMVVEWWDISGDEALGVELPGVGLSEGGEGDGGGSIRQSPVCSMLKTRWERSMG